MLSFDSCESTHSQPTWRTLAMEANHVAENSPDTVLHYCTLLYCEWIHTLTIDSMNCQLAGLRWSLVNYLQVVDFNVGGLGSVDETTPYV